MKPAREVITRSPYRSVGVVHATWLQEDPIHHESDLELGAIESLVLIPQVCHIQHQAIKVSYELDGQNREHFPDFQLRLFCDRKAIVEVKPACFVDEHRVKFNASATQLATAGIDYYVCTDEWLDDERCQRAASLRRAARRRPPPGSVEHLCELVRRVGALQIEEAVRLGIDPNVIAHCVGRRHLTVGHALDVSPANWLRPMELESASVLCSDWLGGPPWRPNL